MKGFPKFLNTKQDYLNVINLFPEDKWKPKLQALLDERIRWVNEGLLVEDDPGITDETHKVREDLDEQGVVSQRYQLHYKEDPNSRLFRLGFTVEEAQALIEA